MNARQEHLKWCKKRDHDLLGRGDLKQAVLSMHSDLSKHPATENLQNTSAVLIGSMDLSSADQVRRYINGFH